MAANATLAIRADGHQMRERLLRRVLTTPNLLLAPIILCLVFFYLGPIVFGVWAGFQEDASAMIGGRFAGFSNYRSLLADEQFYSSLQITVVFTVSTVVVTYVAGLLLAMFINRNFRGRVFFSSAMLIPWTMPLVVVAVVWGWLLDYQFGAVNYVLEQLGLIRQPVGFLTDPDVALWSVGIAQVWRMFPLAMVTLLAALKAIPHDLYEAVAIDGATRLQAFRHVTLPSIRPTTIALTLLLGIWAFGRAFTILFVMTGGGPAGATQTLVVQTYLEAFRYFHLERASALGTIVLVLSAVLTAFYLKVQRD